MNSQAPLDEQLRRLVQLANRNGLYDAADFLRDRIDAAAEYFRLHRSMGHGPASCAACAATEAEDPS